MSGLGPSARSGFQRLDSGRRRSSPTPARRWIEGSERVRQARDQQGGRPRGRRRSLKRPRPHCEQTGSRIVERGRSAPRFRPAIAECAPTPRTRGTGGWGRGVAKRVDERRAGTAAAQGGESRHRTHAGAVEKRKDILPRAVAKFGQQSRHQPLRGGVPQGALRRPDPGPMRNAIDAARTVESGAMSRTGRGVRNLFMPRPGVIL